MRLYDIDAAILGCIDQETGEIIDVAALEALQMERRGKLRNIAFLAINSEADAASCKAQEEKFRKRRQSAERTLAWCKEMLSRELGGKPMREPEFTVSFRKSAAVSIADEAALPEAYWRVRREPDKAAIKDALRRGEDVPGARLEERQGISIK